VPDLVPVYVAAGSNVEPERHLAQAVLELQRTFPGVRFSSWYRNRAAGFTGDDFINLACGFETPLFLDAVLAELHRIEALCGRPREAPRWAPRSMDLDVLLYGDLVCAGRVTLPRPDLLTRAYMLGPLAELAPGLRHPTERLTIGELWERFDRHSHPLTRLDPGEGTGPSSAPRSGPRLPRAPGR
jgi:2-amino-4-hydroxy-6-hydroxymethyldihydropteridine diphosphokinase